MQKFKDYFLKDNFAAANGIKLIECSPGNAKAEVTIEEKHLNGAGITHGGLLFTLADFAFAAAVNSFGFVTLSINAAVSYFAKSKQGKLVAEAKIISRSSKLITCDINIYDEKNELISNFKGTAYITKEKINY
ncbi:MAG: PaaI family thioesterase [Ignavibacteria bacterium]|nr:PaaI family thioesterase [Ignavibacteria bacterium]